MKINSLLPALMSLDLDMHYPKNKFDFHLLVYESFAVDNVYYNIIFTSCTWSIDVVLEPVSKDNKYKRRRIISFSRAYVSLQQTYTPWSRVGRSRGLWLDEANYKWMNGHPLLSEHIELICASLMQDIEEIG